MNLPVIITKQDAARLRPLTEINCLTNGVDAESLKRLKRELERAKIVSEQDLPTDVISMNSTVELEDLTDGETFIFTLVYPEQADINNGRISILAPLGTAMLGYRVGYEFEWPVPAGKLKVRVKSLKGRGIQSLPIATAA